MDVALAVDRHDAIPADTLTYTATVSNRSSTVAFSGGISVTGRSSQPATAAAYSDDVEYYSEATKAWVPLAGAAAALPGYVPAAAPPLGSGLNLNLTAVPAVGVTYPGGGDPVTGAVIADKAAASWTYAASLSLSPAQIALLSDPRQAGRLRNVFHVEVIPRTPASSQPFVDKAVFTNPFQPAKDAAAGGDDDHQHVACSQPSAPAQSGAATKVSVTLTNPAGTTAHFDPSTTPALASVSPNGVATLTSTYSVPAPAARGATETESDYRTRLTALEGSTLKATASATGTAANGSAVTTPTVTAETIEHVPVVGITKTGSAKADPGTSATYSLALTNTGKAVASGLAVTDSLPGGATGTVTAVPPSLDPGQSATAQASYAIPAAQPAGNLVDTASVTWKDAHGNAYGPLSSSYTTVIGGSQTAPSIAAVATTPVQGNFFPEDPAATTFVAKPGDKPAFSQSFPTIDFNPPDGIVPHNDSGVSPSTRPFTDLTTDLVGNYSGTLVAQGNGQQAGTAKMSGFDAAFTADFVVAKAGDVTFNVVANDGFLLGVGGSATRVSGSYENVPTPAVTAFKNYPLVGAWDQPSGAHPGTYPVTIHFPAPGHYPYELDYFECCGQDLSLTLALASFNADTSPLSVYVAYADGLRPAGSIFPFPWKDSPNVVFLPGGGSDDGAMRFDNNSNTPLNLDQVTVDIGGAHFDIWPHNISIPAHNILILTGTGGDNFDSSDFSNAGCGQNNNIIPRVNLTMAGATTSFDDSNQVLNTKGFDAACQGNESHAWDRIGGGGTAINVPLPPAVTLIIAPKTRTATVGQSQAITVQAMDVAGKPVPKLPIVVTVNGGNKAPDNQQLKATTDPAGVATVSYVGVAAETDAVSATALISGLQTVSNAASVQWVTSPAGPPGPLPPSVTSPSPADGAIVSMPVPVTATISPPSGQSIKTWSVTYQAEATGSPVVTLASGTGKPPATLATFDPTLLPDDTYTLAITATASGGGVQVLDTSVAVTGNLKLGRYVTTYHDLDVPVNGFEMQVSRTYDSTDARIGDFGVGWHVAVSNFRTSTNRKLGAGGWVQYGTNCFGALCLYAFRTTTPHYVTVTFPDGHEEQFDFTPQGGSTLFNAANAAFTARPGTGTTSRLSSPASLGLTTSGDLVDDGGKIFNPQRFTLTTRNGRVLVLDVASGLVSETDPNGNAVTVDGTGLHSTNGQSLTFTRDGQGRITAVTGPAGTTLSYAYSSSGDLVSSTDANGNVIAYHYDAGHHLLDSIGSGGQVLNAVTYDSSGRVTAITDGAGHTTTIANDVAAQRQTTTDPLGQLTSVYSFDDLGDLIRRVQVPKGGAAQTTTMSYDPVGRPTSMVDASGATRKTTYDSVGDVTQTTNPLGSSDDFTYDQSGNLLTVVDALGTVQESATYDAAGKPTAIRRADGSTVTLTYDGAGHLTMATDPAGSPTSYDYDSAGHLVNVTDPLGNQWQASYDPGGNIVSVKAGGSTTSRTYDADGNITSVTDGNGQRWAYTYNSFDQLVTETDPLGHATTATYDGAQRLATQTDRNGVTTTYTYDGDGRLTNQSMSSGDTVGFTYDAFGRATTMQNGTATIQHSYDVLGRLVSEQSSGPSLPTTTFSYNYDADGGTTSRSGPDGTLGYSYDALGRLTKITDTSGGAFTLGYDSLSRLTSMSRPNSITDQLTHDALGNLTSRTSSTPTAQVAAAAYTYDANGQVNSSTIGSASTAYSYDALGQLVKAAPAAGPAAMFTYDLAGNRLSSSAPTAQSYSYGSASQLTSDGQFSYSYDSDGRLVSKVAIGSGAKTVYSWDGHGQLKGIQFPDNTTSSFRYDPLGRRVEKVEGGTTTRYGYDGMNAAIEFDGTNTMTASWAYASVDQPLEMTRGGQRYFYLQDGHNNVTGLTNASGATVATYGYDAFGTPTASAGAPANPFLFAGREYDAKSGLYYNRARYLDPGIGRFLSQDPISSVNPYVYGGNDPVNRFDPTGTLTVEFAALLTHATSQLKMGETIASVVRCVGLALVDGLNTLNGGDRGKVADDLNGALKTAAGLVPGGDLGAAISSGDKIGVAKSGWAAIKDIREHRAPAPTTITWVEGRALVVIDDGPYRTITTEPVLIGVVSKEAKEAPGKLGLAVNVISAGKDFYDFVKNTCEGTCGG
ncbi:MAG: hypothetical protein M3137_08205 [Actinomycetota bacterium]|nr:hypothetical protein [Actinomycetota bacterium]